MGPGELRYIARLEVFAAPTPVEIWPADLMRDTAAELDCLLAQCAQLSEEELMRDVHVAMQFDLCRACQRALLARPLGG